MRVTTDIWPQRERERERERENYVHSYMYQVSTYRKVHICDSMYYFLFNFLDGYCFSPLMMFLVMRQSYLVTPYHTAMYSTFSSQELLMIERLQK